MSSLPLTLIDTPDRQHKRLLTEIGSGHFELCIDNTTTEKVQCCDHLFELYSVYGRDVGERDALNYGSAMHKACESFYRGGTLQDMINEVMVWFSEHPCSENSWRNADHAIEACRRYYQWATTITKWEVAKDHTGKLMVEMPFKLPLFYYIPDNGEALCPYPKRLVVKDSDSDEQFKIERVDVYWTGMIDLGIRTPDGKLRPVDHKTSSIGGPTYWKSFNLSSQMMGYTWAAKQIFNEPVEGVTIDCIFGRAPTVKGKGITWDNEVGQFNYTDEQLARWKHNMIAHVTSAIDNLCRGYFPQRTTWCSNKFGMCAYFDVCNQPKPATSAAILMSGQFTETTWNPLNRP